MIRGILGGAGGIGAVLGQRFGIGGMYDSFDSLSSNWTWLLGSGSVNAGALRAATIMADGYNWVPNAEFTVNTSGWTPDNGGTLTRRDFTLAPDIDPTGGIDNYGLEVLNVTANGTAARGMTVLVGATYVGSCRAYAPSANIAVKAAALTMATGAGYPSVKVTLEDVWQTLTLTNAIVSGTNRGLYLQCITTTNGDLAYFDAVSYQTAIALAWHAGFRRTDGTFQAGIPMPATNTTPRSLAFRVVDALNYWEVRVLPNTAGTDTYIIEHVAGVQTTRASADVDWTASATDEIQVVLSGDDITVNHKKSGAGSWTLACSYLTMASGLAADKHGVLLYATGADQYTYWQAN